MSKIGRRQSLKGLAGLYSLVAFSPLQSLADTLVNNLVAEATSKHLQNKLSQEPAKRFLHINLSGAPTRWYFDQLLKPFDSDHFVPHPLICTEFTEPDPNNPLLIQTAYKTTKLHGYNFPTLWLNNVPRAGGGSRPMAELLQNLLMIRGCDMKLDGHFVNTLKQVTNNQGDLSTTGLVADRSGLLMPAISMGLCSATQAFRGRLIKKPVEIPYDCENYLDYILSPFYEQPASGNDLVAAEEAAMDAIAQVAVSNHPASGILANERQRTRKLIQKKIRNLNDVYEGLVKKYDDLLTRTHGVKSIRGISDFKYDFPELPLNVKGEVKGTDLEDFLRYYTLRGKVCESKFSEMQNAIVMKKMAQQFAIAEFCLTENLSSSVTISPFAAWSYSDNLFSYPSCKQSEYKVEYDKVSGQSIISRDPVKFKTVTVDVPFDTHLIGFQYEFLFSNYFYLGFSAALLELTDRLKEVKYENKNLFDETVIQIASEFGREPIRDPKKGTSHSPCGGSSSFISGMVKKPMLVGNISTDSKSPVRRGTRGEAAPMESLDSKNMDHRNVLSTVTALVGVDRIVARSAPLVEVKNGEVVGVIESPKNVQRDIS